MNYEKTTYERLTKANLDWLKENKLDSNEYEQRDKEGDLLIRAFYKQVGLTVNGEFVEIGRIVNDIGMFEQAKTIAKTIVGWSEYLDEEIETIWKDGKVMGRMILSSRGNKYIAGMQIGERFWWATTGSNGVWSEDK
jgi:hypothetical protein